MRAQGFYTAVRAAIAPTSTPVDAPPARCSCVRVPHRPEPAARHRANDFARIVVKPEWRRAAAEAREAPPGGTSPPRRPQPASAAPTGAAAAARTARPKAYSAITGGRTRRRCRLRRGPGGGRRRRSSSVERTRLAAAAAAAASGRPPPAPGRRPAVRLACVPVSATTTPAPAQIARPARAGAALDVARGRRLLRVHGRAAAGAAGAESSRRPPRVRQPRCSINRAAAILTAREAASKEWPKFRTGLGDSPPRAARARDIPSRPPWRAPPRVRGCPPFPK